MEDRYDNARFLNAKKFWKMGRMYDWSDANIHPMTHALHYGTSVFEGIRAYKTPDGPAIFRLPEHIERFLFSASILNMNVPYSKEEIIDACKLVMRENKMDSAYIRPLLYFAYGNLGLVPKVCPVELIVAAWEWGAYLGEKAVLGVHTYILPWKRVHLSQLDMRAKLGGLYVLSCMGGQFAQNKGCDEAVYLNLEGNIAEGPGENIFIVKNEVLKTNDTSESILEGITRTSLLEITAGLGIKTEVGPITKTEFFQADEAFFSGTAVEVVPIIQVTDGSDPSAGEKEYIIGSGEAGQITKKIQQAFMASATGQNADYEHWLTYVNES